jgi:UDP-2,3-diacylglucosamine pyrophosphatase LpxH
VILAHLSDLHLRDTDDAAGFEQQLDRVVARRPDHLVITGDLLDRWDPALLGRALDALAQRGFMDAERLTLIHGNHDLASSGGHPRERSDLLRLVTRFWDPPPVLAARKRTFYRHLAHYGPQIGSAPPFTKTLAEGLRLAAIDTVPAPWKPAGVRRGGLTVHHAEGRIPRSQHEWLSVQRGTGALVVLTHHYPLPVPPFEFDLQTRLGLRSRWLSHLGARHVTVPMEIEPASRAAFWDAAAQARVTLVACGHVHRARLEHHRSIAVGLNGQSGADWAGRTIAYYRLSQGTVTAEYESASRAA